MPQDSISNEDESPHGKYRVGFVGASQVGKSTLINALLGRRLLPSGGVGPLTAQALSICSRPGPAKCVVRFHDRAYLGHLQRDLHHERSFGARSVALGRARLLLSGDASSSLSVDELIGILERIRDRAHLGSQRWVDLERRIGTTEHFSEQAQGGLAAVRAALEVRGAGWLSPLVSSVEVQMDAPIDPSLELVDLPGIGVVGDPQGALAAEHLRTGAFDCVVCVVGNAGLTNAVLDPLLSTGVLGGPRSRVSLVVAVTHVDDVARSRRQAACEEGGVRLPMSPTWFTDEVPKMVEPIRKHLRAVGPSGSVDDVPVAVLAAPAFLSLTEGEPVAMFPTADHTGIPRFRRLLSEFAQSAQFTALSAPLL